MVLDGRELVAGAVGLVGVLPAVRDSEHVRRILRPEGRVVVDVLAQQAAVRQPAVLQELLQARQRLRRGEDGVSREEEEGAMRQGLDHLLLTLHGRPGQPLKPRSAPRKLRRR